MANTRLTDHAQTFISQGIKAGDAVIDATAGNGHDALFMARRVGQNGSVYAFDIQQQAIRNTHKLLDEADQSRQLSLVQNGHQTMSQHIPASLHHAITAIMFNLGYLPGADHQLTTLTATTLSALNVACSLLAPGGRISIIAYPGHDNGIKETQMVDTWAESLSTTEFSLSKLHAHSDNPLSPVWFGVIKV